MIKDAYVADHEAWPVYEEVRNNVIQAAELSEDGNVAGVVFVDSADGVTSVEDYTNYGPNNELYLAAGQSIMFQLDLSNYVDADGKSIVDKVHVGLKSADGNAVTYDIYAGGGIDAQAVRNIDKVITTATGMYYDMTSLKDRVIVITNAGESGILSITDVKVTFTEEPSAAETLFYVSSETIQKVLDAINNPDSDETPEGGNGESEGTPDDGTDVPEKVVFVPEQFEVKIDKVKAGKDFKVKITTKSDVAAISVDGTIITNYRYDKKKDVYTWEFKMKAPTDETQMNIVIFAYDAEGNASVASLNVVTVEAENKPAAKAR